MNASTLSFLCMFLFSSTLLFGFFIYSRDRRSLAHQLFLLMSLLLSIWFFFAIFLFSASSGKDAMHYTKLASFGVMLFVPALFCFTLVVTKVARRRWSWLVFLPFLVIAARNFHTPVFFSDIRLINGALRFFPAFQSSWHQVYSILGISCGVSSAFFFIRWYCRATGKREKLQARVMSVSLALWMFVITTEELVLPLLLGISPGLGPVTYSICQLGLGYAILRYSFLDPPVLLAAQEILDHMDSPVFFLDMGLRVSYANKVGREILALEEKEAGTKDFILYTQEADLLREACRFLSTDEQKFRLEKIHLLTTRGPVLYEIRFSLLLDSFGDAAGILLQGMETRKAAFLDRYAISEREFEIILEILAAKTIKEIADHLCISELTVKSHITHIYAKTGVDNRVKLLELLRKFQISP